MKWLNNAWVIGIGTSVLSGLLVTWIARILLSKKENREYQQKLMSANREVIYAIRPGISEGQIPNRDVIIALTQATSRRYGVSASELYKPAEIAEELIKEVMDSSFLPAARKAEYCSQLNPIRVEPPPPPVETSKSEAGATYRRKMTEMLSLIAGLFTSLATGMVALVATKAGSSVNAETVRLLILFVTSVLIVILAVVVITVVFRPAVLRNFSRRVGERMGDRDEEGKEK